MRLAHAVLTRFNLGRPAEAAWLEHRVRLFERFCLPSLRGQSCQSFTWLLFCDAGTGEPWRSRLLAYESANTQVVWVPYESGDIYETQASSCYAQAVRSLLRGDEEVVLTTRCDNDDALAFDFVERLQQEVRPEAGREFLNFLDGCIWHQGRVSPATIWSNHFLSYCEPADPADRVLTVMHTKHPKAERSASVRDLGDGNSYWLEVLHERNLVNGPGPHAVGFWWTEEDLERRFELDLSVSLAAR